jgi:hypothetical protein
MLFTWVINLSEKGPVEASESLRILHAHPPTCLYSKYRGSILLEY